MNEEIENIIVMFITGAVLVLFDNKDIGLAFGGGDKTAECMLCTKVTFNGFFTNWTISHLLFFFIAALVAPSYPYVLIALGVFWEAVELFLEYNCQTNAATPLRHIVSKCHKQMNPTEFWRHYFGKKDSKKSIYWCSGGFVGSLMDILADTLGVVLGMWFTHRYPWKESTSKCPVLSL